MYKKELETAVNLAKQASRTILEFYAQDIVIEEKIGVDQFAEPVTAADREASRIIVAGLRSVFPDDGILSEEEPDDVDHRLSKDRVWIIDPIDGTSGFIKKDGDFGIQIGMAENGQPVVGVVLLPARNAVYFATKGNGCFISENDAPPVQLHVSTETDFSKMNLAASRNHRNPNMERIIKEFGFNKEIQRGSVGLKVGLIAEEVCDLYIHLSSRTKFWDTCGPQIILEEAGGKVTDILGNPLRYDLRDVQNHYGILASNGAVHTAAIDKLKPMLNEFSRPKLKF